MRKVKFLLLTALSLSLVLSCPDPKKIPDNPLPEVIHGFSMGYYYLDGKYGDFWNDASCYTDLYVVNRSNYSADPGTDWQSQMARSLNAAHNHGFRKLILSVMCDIDPNTKEGVVTPEGVDTLNAARNSWNDFDEIYLEIGHEINWASADKINKRCDALIQELRALNLSAGRVKVGATYGVVPDSVRAGLTASNLRWVGIEAYLFQYPASSGEPDSASLDTCVNVKKLQDNFLQSAKNTESNQEIVLIMMSYDRNGCWLRNGNTLNNLVDLQYATYYIANWYDRVKAVTMFSFGRDGSVGDCGAPYGGAHKYPELASAHIFIAQKVFELASPPACSNQTLFPVNLPPCLNYKLTVTYKMDSGNGGNTVDNYSRLAFMSQIPVSTSPYVFVKDNYGRTVAVLEFQNWVLTGDARISDPNASAALVGEFQSDVSATAVYAVVASPPPGNEYQVTSNPPTFTWPAAAPQYWLLVSDNPDVGSGTFLIDEQTLATNSYTAKNVFAPGTYFWKVKFKVGPYANWYWSPIMCFTIQ
jgi:hypothetical protein